MLRVMLYSTAHFFRASADSHPFCVGTLGWLVSSFENEIEQYREVKICFNFNYFHESKRPYISGRRINGPVKQLAESRNNPFLR